MSFIVMTDTSSNLPSGQIRQRDIKEISFPYYIKGKTCHCIDTDTFDGESFYKAIKENSVEVTTSQISPLQYMSFYEPWLQEGKDILYVCMSSGISGSHNSARFAASEMLQKYPDRCIEIIDSMGASLGEGLLVLRAADLRDEKISLETAAETLRKESICMCNIFTVDDLMHLKRGGRLSNLSAVIGTVLNLKPILKGNEEGKIVAFAKVRGRKQSVRSLAQLYENMAVSPEKQTVGIAQAACREDAESLASMIQKSRPPKDILIVDYEPVTGSHVGPGALALFFSSYPDIRGYNGDNLPSVMRQAVSRAEEKIHMMQKYKDAKK